MLQFACQILLILLKCSIDLKHTNIDADKDAAVPFTYGSRTRQCRLPTDRGHGSAVYLRIEDTAVPFPYGLFVTN